MLYFYQVILILINILIGFYPLQNQRENKGY